MTEKQKQLLHYQTELLKLYQEKGQYTEALEVLGTIEKELKRQQNNKVEQFLGRPHPIELHFQWRGEIK